MTNETTLLVPADRPEVHIERRFDAPIERVFDAHVNAELIPRWWGPRRLTTRVDLLEPRHGGRWRFVQTDADGETYPFRGVYHLVDAPRRIIATFEFEDAPGAVQLSDFRFAVDGAGCRLTQTTVFLSVADRDGMVEAGMRDGMRESLDRLEELGAH
jgi:uncharacterized protein YndB with AHSA1/START domain